MKKQHALALSLSLGTVGFALFAFLYFYPYQAVSHELFTQRAFSIKERGFNEGVGFQIKNSQDIQEFTSSVEVFYLEDLETLNSFSSTTNTKSSIIKDSHMIKDNKGAIVLSYKGSIMTHSKLTKLKISPTEVKMSFAVENDFILDGSAKPDEETYSYYLVPVSLKNPFALDPSIQIEIKKV